MTIEQAYIGKIVFPKSGPNAGRRGVITKIHEGTTRVQVTYPAVTPRTRIEIIAQVMRSPATIKAVREGNWETVWRYLKITREEDIAQTEGIDADIIARVQDIPTIPGETVHSEPDEVPQRIPESAPLEAEPDPNHHDTGHEARPQVQEDPAFGQASAGGHEAVDH